MTKQSVKKKIKTLLPYILITIFVLVFAISNTTFAKYVGQTTDSSQAIVGDFYFTSVLLQEKDANGNPQEVELYGGDAFVVNLYNTFEGKVSDVDIDFEIVVETENATIAIDEQSTSYIISDESTETKIVGTMKADGESHIAIEVTPTDNENTSEAITITAKSTSPYEKELSASFVSLNPAAIPSDEIGIETVLHENYTELLIVTGSEFTGDVYVIIGDYTTITTQYFPRDLEVANKVKYYTPTSTGGIPTDENTGEPVVSVYVEALQSGVTDYTGVMFYIDLADIFYIEGQAFLKSNRTYVIDFLGETKLDTSTVVGGIIYSNNTDGVNSAVVFLTTATWENTESSYS